MRARDALKYVLKDGFDPETLVTGAAGCPSKYFDGVRNICSLPGKAGVPGNCRACWDQEIRIREDGPEDAPPRGAAAFGLPDLAIAFYNVVSSAVEDYGGNVDRLYVYTKGACDLVDSIAALITGGDRS